MQVSEHPTGADLPPWEAVALLRRELALYNSELPAAPALVVANKVDRLQDPSAQLEKLRCSGGGMHRILYVPSLYCSRQCTSASSHSGVPCNRRLSGMLVVPVSALKGHGLQDLQAAIRQLVIGSSRHGGREWSSRSGQQALESADRPCI